MKQALFLLNMGGPSNIPEVKLFLQNMFSDKNILPVNPLARKLIGTIIVKKRLHEAEENYQALGGKSPLLELTIKLIEKLQSKLDMPIYPAMRYVPPFATESLEKCKQEGIEELVLFPLYPQYSTTTTLSSYEDIKERCSALGYTPKLTLIDPYYDEYEYIEASCEKILEAIDGKDSKQYDLLLSAHGLPVSIIEAGDPYQRHVEANVSAIKIYLKTKGIEFNSIKLVYQSKVGPSAWLEPSLVDILRNPTNKKVVIYPLAFTIDNSETVYELGIEHAEIARKIKYEDYRVASCMNDSDKFAEFIAQKVKPAQDNHSKTKKTR